MDYLKDVIKAIKPILKDYGMKKKNYNWYSEDSNIVKIFNIQKSTFSNKIYLNIGIKIKAIDKNSSFSIVGSHISGRLDNLIEKNVLDFEKDILISKRCKIFCDLLGKNPYNFFTLTGSKTELKEFIQNSHSVITKDTEEYLNI